MERRKRFYTTLERISCSDLRIQWSQFRDGSHVDLITGTDQKCRRTLCPPRDEKGQTATPIPTKQQGKIIRRINIASAGISTTTCRSVSVSAMGPCLKVTIPRNAPPGKSQGRPGRWCDVSSTFTAPCGHSEMRRRRRSPRVGEHQTEQVIVGLVQRRCHFSAPYNGTAAAPLAWRGAVFAVVDAPRPQLPAHERAVPWPRRRRRPSAPWHQEIIDFVRRRAPRSR